MTTAFVIAATCILIAGLFAVIVERTNERDEARETARRLDEQLTAERTVRQHTEHALAEFQQAVSDAGGRIVLPLTGDDGLTYDQRVTLLDHFRKPSNVVPLQRDGAHDRLAMSSEEWAAIERETRDV